MRCINLYWAYLPLKMKTLRCTETSGSDHPVTYRRIPYDRLLQKLSCENFKPSTSRFPIFLFLIKRKEKMFLLKWKFLSARNGYVQIRTVIFLDRSHIYEHFHRTYSWPWTFTILSFLMFYVVSVLPWTLLFNIINSLHHAGHLTFCLPAGWWVCRAGT
jgi:hypothetical protein